MTAEELWQLSNLTGTYESWAFDEAPDQLASLVIAGVKTATCSAYDLYLSKNEDIPEAGGYSVILDAKGNALCIIRTTNVYVTAFDQVSANHAYKEGEGDRSLSYWRDVHQRYLKHELLKINQSFNLQTKVVCEEFEVVYV